MATQARDEKSNEVQRTTPAAAPRELSSFEDVDRMFDRMMEAFIPRGFMRPFRTEWPAWSQLQPPFEGRTPRVDVIERDDEICVRAELPGVKKDDLDVSMTENSLTIRATTSQKAKEETGEYHRAEIARGSFVRTLALPATVDGAKAKASFKEGLLELTIPKMEKAKRRSIKVE